MDEPQYTEIAKLKAGDEQSFLLPPTFTTTETGFTSIAINENVTVSIFSLGNAVIDAHGKSTMFVVTKGALLITGVTLQHGHTTNGGGAISINGGHATLTNCTFNGNTATGYHVGGAIAINGGNATLTNCMFITNTAEDGGAISIFGGGNATLTNCTFNGNTATGTLGGGAIWAQAGAEVLIISSSFKGGAGSHADSVYNYKLSGNPDASMTFACPSTSTGAPYTLPAGQQLEASQLPPATELVHCKPKLP
jgi:hypothetical protein